MIYTLKPSIYLQWKYVHDYDKKWILVYLVSHIITDILHFADLDIIFKYFNSKYWLYTQNVLEQNRANH